MHTLNNQVQLIGRAGHPVEMLRLTDGNYRATLRLYQDQRTPSGVGEPQIHALVGWGSVATQMEKQIGRGDRIMVQGRIVNRKFELGGRTQVRSEIHVAGFTILNARRTVAPEQMPVA